MHDVALGCIQIARSPSSLAVDAALGSLQDAITSIGDSGAVENPPCLPHPHLQLVMHSLPLLPGIEPVGFASMLYPAGPRAPPSTCYTH